VLDIAALLTIINNVWGEAFQADLGNRTQYVNELRDVVNGLIKTLSLVTYPTFDAMTRLLELVLRPNELSLRAGASNRAERCGG
jgi:hypothetical protein